MKYKAFISYCHTQIGRRHATALETALKRYAKPSLARPMKIFRDEKHMKPDISLPKLIQEGLENSEYLIFLGEKASAASPWCRKELEVWCSPEKLNRSSNLIIVLIGDDITLKGINEIDWSKTNALPALLQPYLPSTPLYVDLRWANSAADTNLQNPEYRHEINALSARLKGVNPEDLNDEEIRGFRRNIRLRNSAIVVLLTMLLLAVGAMLWALDAQKEAEENAAKALEQQQIAEKNLADRIEQETLKERLNFDKYVREGDVFVTSGDFKIALRYYRRADSILQKFPKDQQLLAKKDDLTRKLKLALTKTQSEK